MIVFVDCEASSLLPGSYPIEVGWVDEDGRGEAYLISPARRWLERGTWSEEAEAVHGISLETLLLDGMPVSHVAARVADALCAPDVQCVSDASAYDEGWLEMLMAAAGRMERVAVGHLHSLYGEECRGLGADALRIVACAENDEERERHGVTRHRAMDDALSMRRRWLAVRRLAAEARSAKSG